MVFFIILGLVSKDIKVLIDRLIDLFAMQQAMASPEDKAYEIMRELDVSYVLVIFGGLTGYSSDG